MKTAKQYADEYQSAPNSAITLTTIEVDGIEYDLQVCDTGDDAFFEWINEDGDPIGDMFYEIDGIEEEAKKFKEFLLSEDSCDFGM